MILTHTSVYTAGASAGGSLPVRDERMLEGHTHSPTLPRSAGNSPRLPGHPLAHMPAQLPCPPFRMRVPKNHCPPCLSQPGVTAAAPTEAARALGPALGEAPGSRMQPQGWASLPCCAHAWPYCPVPPVAAGAVGPHTHTHTKALHLGAALLGSR